VLYFENPLDIMNNALKRLKNKLKPHEIVEKYTARFRPKSSEENVVTFPKTTGQPLAG
jgi:hypothetical protein